MTATLTDQALALTAPAAPPVGYISDEELARAYLAFKETEHHLEHACIQPPQGPAGSLGELMLRALIFLDDHPVHRGAQKRMAELEQEMEKRIQAAADAFDHYLAAVARWESGHAGQNGRVAARQFVAAKAPVYLRKVMEKGL